MRLRDELCTSRMMIGSATTRLDTPLMMRSTTGRRERNGSQTDSCMMTTMNRTREDLPLDPWRMYATCAREAYGHCHHSPHHGSPHSMSHIRDHCQEGVGRLLPPNLAHCCNGVGRLLPPNTAHRYKGTGRFLPTSPTHSWRTLVPMKGSNRTTSLLHQHLKSRSRSQKC